MKKRKPKSCVHRLVCRNAITAEALIYQSEGGLKRVGVTLNFYNYEKIRNYEKKSLR